MKTLPLTFRKGGFDYQQVERRGTAAIYRQTKPGLAGEWFEVGKIRQNQARHQFGRDIPASESWPTSEEWGIRAYTCPDLASVQRRLAILIPPNA